MQAAQSEQVPIETILQFETGRFQIVFSKVGRFTVTGGRHVLLEPVPGTQPALWRLPLLGSVMALLLEQRAFFVLHAGAIQIGDGAAAFLGEKGQGKSTLNASLARAGFALFSDDVVALNWEGNSGFPSVWPGFSQIKLVPDAVSAVLPGALEDWPAVTPGVAEVDKRAFCAPLAQQVLPLRDLFILASKPTMESSLKSEEIDGGISISRLAPQQAFARLLPHTYGARFSDFYLKDERKKTHFSACARLVRECRVWELARRRDLSLLPATIAAIVRTVETHSSRHTSTP